MIKLEYKECVQKPRRKKKHKPYPDDCFNYDVDVTGLMANYNDYNNRAKERPVDWGTFAIYRGHKRGKS